MAGVDVIMDLVMKNHDFTSGQKFDSNKLGASLAVVAPYLADRSALSGSKQYDIKLEPIYSALKWDALGLTSLKYLTYKFFSLLKSRSRMRDLVVESWDAAKYIFFEVICTTTKRLLERLAVLCFSPRIAWKLVRDVAASATRLATVKGVSGFKFIFRAAKTTFLGNAIGAIASWLVQLVQHIFGFFVFEKGDHPVDTWERVWILGKKILGVTVKCIIAFIFACICAAVVAHIFGLIGTWITLPSALAWIAAKLGLAWIATGLQIGFAFGDFAGNALISFCLGKLGL